MHQRGKIMENGYIIVGLNGYTKWCISDKVKDILQRIKPKGFPFYDYSMFTLLNDWICMYSWQIERNKKISLADFVREIKVDGKSIYKETLIHIFEMEKDKIRWD